MAAGEFDMGDHERFMREQFGPFLERFDRHMDADDRRFEQMTDAIHRVSSAFETQTAVQQAILSQAQRLFSNWWTRCAVIAMLASPAVAIGIAVLK